MSLVRTGRAWVAIVALAAASGAWAQSMTTTTTHKSGTVESVSGNKLTVREADGLHTYDVPPDFRFHMGSKRLSVSQLQPGMGIDATIKDQAQTVDTTSTSYVSGTVLQVAPGGIVVKTPTGDKSYNFKDAEGRDQSYYKDGKQVPLSTIKQGEKLEGTIVRSGEPVTSTLRMVTANVTAAPVPDAAPAVVAAAPAKKLPKTASPLPVVALAAALSAAVAFGLRRWRIQTGR